MGCESSMQVPEEIVQTQTEEQFKLSYRQFIVHDRGQVFQFYHFSNILSKSSSSIVRRVIKRNNQQTKICKIIPISTKKSIFGLAEIEVLKKVNHPNIVQAQQFFLQADFVYIIMEEIPGKGILQSIKEYKNLNFGDIVEIMIQLLATVEYLHKKMIVHRTLSPQNVMVMWNNRPIVKVIDFAQTTQKDCPKPFPVSSHKQNFIYDTQLVNPVNIQKIDIRDCGLLFYYILSGEKPCKGHDFQEQRAKYLVKLSESMKLFKKLGDNLKESLIDLISKMIESNRELRPTAQECLKHNFFGTFQKINQQQKLVKKTPFQEELISNLIKFQGEDRLKTMIYMYFSLNLTSTIEKSEYINEFYNLDKNKDGEIQFQQLVQGLVNSYSFSQEKAFQCASTIFNNLDKNKSGSLDFNEFVMGSMDLSKLMSEQTLKKIFKELDTNGDKRIDIKQINNLIFGIEGYDMFKGKTSITFEDFKETMFEIIKMKDSKQKEIIRLSQLV